MEDKEQGKALVSPVKRVDAERVFSNCSTNSSRVNVANVEDAGYSRAQGRSVVAANSWISGQGTRLSQGISAGPSSMCWLQG